MITTDQIIGLVIGIIIGMVGTVGALYNRMKSSITPTEAQDIYIKAKAAIDDYNSAMSHGPMTTEEKLQVAEKTLIALQALIKSMEK